MKRANIVSFVALVGFAAIAALTATCSSSDSLAEADRPSMSALDALVAGFRSPPDSAKPHTWWHWMNGNVTREGITADLEAMKKIGLGGAQIFNVSESIPEGPVAYNSPEWRALVKHAASEAQRLGLELCIHNCAGWSSSGGPWVLPEFAMQTVVTSEAHATGPSHFSSALAQPPTKADFYRDVAVLAFPTPADAAILRQSIVDLTSRLHDGKLEWDVPPGSWTILRIGHTPTGAVNAPAPAIGRGLEVDKLSRDAFDHYWAGGMAPLLKELGPLAGRSLRNCLIDSYEVGCQNWTTNFRAEFEKRRGYDPLLFLPTMTGRVVDSGEVSEKFLWDLRRTIGDLFAENYYSYFAETCRKNGLLASVEPYDGPFECTQVARDADIVMGEFWVTSGMSYSCKLAASVSHVYGKRIVGAESFTAEPSVGRWLNFPGSLKKVGDRIFSEGINRYIIHRYAHQPWMNVLPGMTMGQWGTHFERTTTWWDPGKAWISYLARCQYLLQQGAFVADVLYFAGDGAPNSAPHEPGLKTKGYDYDACGADVLLHRVTAKHGQLVLPDGMSYRLLVLPDSKFMTRSVLARVTELAKQGVPVVAAQPPTNSPGLSADPNASTNGDVASIAAALQHGPIEQVLAERKIAPDCTFTSASVAKPDVAWIHRAAGDVDLYFVSNQMPRNATIDGSFRVSGKQPELWHPDTGRIEPAPIWSEQDGRTSISMQLEPTGSLFVVFRPMAAPARDHVVAVQAPADVAAQARGPLLVITKARYDAIDGAGGADVTTKVAELAAAGTVEIPANNDVFGDTAVNHVKRLTVEYTLDGKPMKQSADENALLSLNASATPAAPSAWSLAAAADGVVELHAFRPGRYLFEMASGRSRECSVASVPDPIAIDGAWTVRFEPGRGAPATAQFAQLDSWTNSTDAGIKYFSGGAVYEKSFELPREAVDPGSSPRRVVMLDLGRVREIAEVTLNGVNLGVAWKAPFVLDVTSVAKAGRNELAVRVTNLWVNRLIGDEQFPDDCEWAHAVPTPLKKWPSWFAPDRQNPLANRPVKERLTFTTWKHWTKDSPLIESGLLGPVVVRIGIVQALAPTP